jgi:hypothetical protein
VLKSEIVSQLQKTKTLRGLVMELRKLSERISVFRPKTTSYYDLKKYKPWFKEECSDL